jgi:hypothetical protein
MIVQPPLNEALGRQEATLGHALAHFPELLPSKLLALGGELPPRWTLGYNGSGAPVTFDEREMADRLDNTACSLRLYHLELLPAFAGLIRGCYLEAGVHEAATLEGGVTAESSIAFIGSGGATTPLHLDHHHNLLLQITGTKVLTVAGFDTAERQRREVERAFTARGACSTAPAWTRTYRLGPGDGVYVPPYTFHSAKVLEGETSVALSCAFSTLATERAFRVHRVNLALTRLRLRPAPAGASATRDATKDWLGRGLQRVRPARA